MKIQRQEVARKYYGKHSNINNEDKDSILNYLNEIKNYLNNYEYESNSDFIYCGRKKHIYEEIVNVLNETQKVDNPIYFALGSLEEFICNNNDVHISDSDDIGMNWNELREANDRYINTGVICLEEKKYIDSIIDKIEGALAVHDRLTNYEGEFKFLNSICEVCVNYNNGKRSDKCPLDLLDKINNNEINCPNFKKEDLFKKNVQSITYSSNNSLSQNMNEMSNKYSVNKGIHTREEMPWVDYLQIDDNTHERRLIDNAPEDIKVKYQEYLNGKIDEAVKILASSFENLSNDEVTTVIELLGYQPERYDGGQLTKIASNFFEKYSKSIEFVDESNQNVALLYNLRFKKKIIGTEQDNYNSYKKNENDSFSSVLNNKGMFHLSIISGAVLPITHPRFYEGRKNIILDKDLENNYVYRQDIEIEKDKYHIDEQTIDEIIEYVKINFNKLLEIAANQSMEMYDGVVHSINVKLGSIYLTLSELNTTSEEDNQFLGKFEEMIVEILTYPKCPICKKKLNYMMPDGTTLCCNSCNKYFTNENGKVGQETSYPYIDNNADY